VIPARSFANSDVGVFGLARSGVSSVVSLKAGGAQVYAWDDNAGARDAAERAGATVLPYQKWPWDRIKALILSPGVPLTHPKPHDIVVTAREAGAEVIGDIELFAREIRPDPAKPGRSPVIAITGTNGKSTTTA
jgi:UDP-N-acetylmuramoylalanine--D-glutamate ligase